MGAYILAVVLATFICLILGTVAILIAVIAIGALVRRAIQGTLEEDGTAALGRIVVLASLIGGGVLWLGQRLRT